MWREGRHMRQHAARRRWGGAADPGRRSWSQRRFWHMFHVSYARLRRKMFWLAATQRYASRVLNASYS